MEWVHHYALTLEVQESKYNQFACLASGWFHSNALYSKPTMKSKTERCGSPSRIDALSEKA